MTDKRARRRSVLWGFAAGGLLYVIGAPLSHAVLVALAIVATGPVLHAASIELLDRPEVPRHLRREGSRRELAKLTRYRGRRSRVTDEEAVRRLRAVARRRLADLHLDVDVPEHAPAVLRLLGPLPYGVLIARTGPPHIHDRLFSHCVDAVEALARRRQESEAGQATSVRGTS
jgi:hypothetical protein